MMNLKAINKATKKLSELESQLFMRSSDDDERCRILQAIVEATCEISEAAKQIAQEAEAVKQEAQRQLDEKGNDSISGSGGEDTIVASSGGRIAPS